jgi:hypothetical protein
MSLENIIRKINPLRRINLKKKFDPIHEQIIERYQEFLDRTMSDERNINYHQFHRDNSQLYDELHATPKFIDSCIKTIRKRADTKTAIQYINIIKKYSNHYNGEHIANRLSKCAKEKNSHSKEIAEIYNSFGFYKASINYNDLIIKEILKTIIPSKDNHIVKTHNWMETMSLRNTINHINETEQKQPIKDSHVAIYHASHISQIAYDHGTEFSTKVIDFLRKYSKNNERVWNVSGVINFLGDTKLNDQFMRVLNKYDKLNLSDIIAEDLDVYEIINPMKRTEFKTYVNRTHVREYKLDKLTKVLVELDDNESYKFISQSPDSEGILRSLINRDQDIIQKNILNVDLKYTLNIRDTTHVKRAYTLMMNLHKDKSDDAKKELEDGFFRIMNEKLTQGESNYDKINILKRWGTQVCTQLKKNGNELRYVHAN